MDKEEFKLENKKVIPMGKKSKVETQADRDEKILRLLKRSRDENYYVTARVSGVEVLPMAPEPVAVVYMEGFKILIPASEMVDIDPTINNPRPIEEQQRFLLERRINAEIDFIVTEIDEEEQFAVASRKKAMKRRVEEQMLRKDNETGEYLIDEGSFVEARIVATFRGSIVVEAFGVESTIPIKELSYARMSDASDSFQVGEWTVIKILKIKRDVENAVVSMEASVKQTKPHPFDNHNLAEGNRYVGEISYIENTS